MARKKLKRRIDPHPFPLEETTAMNLLHGRIAITPAPMAGTVEGSLAEDICPHCNQPNGPGHVIFDNIGIERLGVNLYRTLKHCHECDTYWWVILGELGTIPIQPDEGPEARLEEWIETHQIGG